MPALTYKGFYNLVPGYLQDHFSPFQLAQPLESCQEKHCLSSTLGRVSGSLKASPLEWLPTKGSFGSNFNRPPEIAEDGAFQESTEVLTPGIGDGIDR